LPFTGKRVLALETRRSAEIAELIRKQGGEPFVAPALREAPLEHNQEALQFLDRLFAGDFEMVILLTGVGTRQLSRLLGPRFADGLRRVTIVARGPKPVSALREMGLAPAIVAPEPNTWREVLQVTEGCPERRIAVQEYGRPATELIKGLQARGAVIAPFRLYQYALPEDLDPLREAARRLAHGDFDAALFTTAVQIEHLMRIASDLGFEEQALAGLRKAWVGSIGPSTTEALAEFGIAPQFEPSHPKMGLLVNEAAQRID